MICSFYFTPPPLHLGALPTVLVLMVACLGLRRGGWKFCLHHAILAVQGGHADTLMYMLNWDVLGRDADHAGKCFLMKVAAEKEQLECLKRILLWTKSGAIPRECRLRRSARSFCSGCLKLLYGGKN